ncbi:MAG: tRNA preQ1(34) S-adenosylmethionine ribosyltransferase-isomerase QueA [Candidatus Dojkabacteria bacterium]|nr:MAG: tRNA preQ1(34) S-adenosylmethionine ribosyltransferase-isomerase QueA [Candidatus Dojkabacteria bacterium]
MLTTDFDYNLPSELIADSPPAERGTTRLMVLDKNSSKLSHKNYSDIPDYIEVGDVVVLNRTLVQKARLYMENSSNGKRVEVLFLNRVNLNEQGNEKWFALIGRAKNVQAGDLLRVVDASEALLKVLSRGESGEGFLVEILDISAEQLFSKYGNVPLPAYIKREATAEDEIRYNTVFGSEPGSVAAPTASLNLTDELIDQIKARGAEVVFVELDIGWGTFAPVRTEKIEDFQIHTERYHLSEETAAAVNKAISSGKNVWAFGTTATRVLESCAYLRVRNEDAGLDGVRYLVKASSGETNIYIYPGYEWKIVNRLVTNFHAPKSSLIMLVASFAGYDLTMRAYQEAIDQEYKFLSYGDSMLILG